VALPEGRFAIKFSAHRHLLHHFDIEMLFLGPWAYLSITPTGLVLFLEMMVFLGILMLGFSTSGRSGGSNWE